LGNTQAAEQAAQEFQVRVQRRGLGRATPEHGRLRDDLRQAVRRAALSYLRRRQAGQHNPWPLWYEAIAEAAQIRADQPWRSDWRGAWLEGAWRPLDRRQHRRSPGRVGHTVLRVTLDHPHDEARKLAARASARLGRLLRLEAFHQQLSRARRLFARLLVRE